MAAIIAHITRANRERIEKKRYEIVISKCMYEIRPFERTYDPKVRYFPHFLLRTLVIPPVALLGY